jgi:acetoin utilization protein AcuB
MRTESPSVVEPRKSAPRPTVADVMHPDPIAVRADEDLLVTAVRMTREEIRHMPIVDADDQVIGILSDRDLRVVLGDPAMSTSESADDGGQELTVDWAMTADPVTLCADAPAADLVPLLVEQRLGAVPVVDRATRRLVGIVSYVDLLRFLLARSPL